jgi:hypothetical protein
LNNPQQQQQIYNTPVHHNGTNSSMQVNRNLGFASNAPQNQQYSPVYGTNQYSQSPIYTSNNNNNNNQNSQYDTLAGVRYQQNTTERPMMPPPPIPKNIQNKQYISSTINDLHSNGVSLNREDLPPPPSPPHISNINHYVQHFHKSPSPPPLFSSDLVDNSELPLPPPPPDDFIVQDIQNYEIKRSQQPNVPLPPPPPPAPPLPNFDFSSVILSNAKTSTINNNNDNNGKKNVNNARNGVLDAIKNGMFLLFF